jgi:dTMP kinase
MAYQGIGRGLGEDVVHALHRVACRGLHPRLTLCYDIDVATGLARARARGVNRMDDQAVDFHRRVRAAYQAIAAREPRVTIIDGTPPPAVVFQSTWLAVEPLLVR